MEMPVYAIYLASPEHVGKAVKDVLEAGGRVIATLKTFGIVVAELSEGAVAAIMNKDYVRMVEKSYPFSHV